MRKYYPQANKQLRWAKVHKQKPLKQTLESFAQYEFTVLTVQ